MRFLVVALVLGWFASPGNFVTIAAAAASTGQGMLARFTVKDRTKIPNLNTNDYALVRRSPYVAGALGWFSWSELEPAEGATHFAPIDDFARPWIADGKKLAIGVVTSPDGVPGWVYAAGAASVTGEPPANRVYPVYWDSVYQQKFGAFLQRLAARYASDPALELLVMGGFGEGITEHMTDNDSGTETSFTAAQWQAAGVCQGLTANECTNFWPHIWKTPYLQAIQDVRALYRTAFPTNILLTRVHELGEAVISPFEAALRSNSVAQGYALANDGANINVAPESRAGLRTLSQSVKVGWISFTGRDKKVRDAPLLTSTPGGALAARTYYVKFTWVLDNGGESTPSPSSNLTAAAGQLLVATIPPFATEVSRANVYAGFSRNSAYYLQGSVTNDGGAWTEPATGIVTNTSAPPTVNTAFGSVLDLYQHLAGLDAHAKLSNSAHLSYIFRDIDTLIRSVPGTTTYSASDPEKYFSGLVWAAEHFWPAPAPVVSLAASNPVAGITLGWPAVTGFSYQAQSSTNLFNWANAGPAIPAATNFLLWTDNETASARERFYRVQLPP